MIKMKLAYLVCLSIALYLIPVCQGSICLRTKELTGEISGESRTGTSQQQCWIIEVPQNTYVKLNITKMLLSSVYSCSETFLKITVIETKENYTFCSKDNESRKPVIAFSDISINFSTREGRSKSTFEMKYHIEDLTCIERNHFRCTNHSCIHESKVCDGVKDCENGADEIECKSGVFGVRGIDENRENTITWLKNQRSFSGWGKNTHRAITSLYLAGAASYQGQNLEEELAVKQLELQTSVALLRNSTDILTVSELSMFINALTVTCHNPRKFYGYDLLQILGERVSKTPSPAAYLTLCNSNWTLTASEERKLVNLLHKHSEYPFHLDMQAMTVMALTCVQNKTPKALHAYNATINKFIDGQLADGSFGNVYTTALVTQALIASGQENNRRWKLTSTVQYLMEQLNSSSIDFLSAYLALPVLNGRSLVDIRTVNCGNISRKEEEDTSDVTNKFGGKTFIQYSLYVGDHKDVIHTIFLRMPENSSAYDVMRVAQVADPKYKFTHRDVSGHMYVYRIADITNDPEAGKFWLLYASDNYINGTIKHHTESPDKFVLEDEAHLIMWYKTAHI